MAKLVFQKLDATAGLASRGRQRREDARDLHPWRTIRVGLGFHGNRAARGLDGIIGRAGP